MPRWLLPDPIETLKAAEALVKQGLWCCPTAARDPVLCKRLEEVGCAAVMLGAPIGSNQAGNQSHAEIIIQQSTVPVVVEASACSSHSDAGAGNVGADAVLVTGNCRGG